MNFLCPVNLVRNAWNFGLMLVDEALRVLSGPAPVVVDGVGPWASTIDLDAVANAL